MNPFAKKFSLFSNANRHLKPRCSPADHIGPQSIDAVMSAIESGSLQIYLSSPEDLFLSQDILNNWPRMASIIRDHQPFYLGDNDSPNLYKAYRYLSAGAADAVLFWSDELNMLHDINTYCNVRALATKVSPVLQVNILQLRSIAFQPKGTGLSIGMPINRANATLTAALRAAAEWLQPM